MRKKKHWVEQLFCVKYIERTSPKNKITTRVHYTDEGYLKIQNNQFQVSN